MVEERTTSFIRSLMTENDEMLKQIALEARSEHIPVIRPETEELLKVLLLANRPKHILEIGTAVGYSAIYMSRYIDADAHITTIENYAPRMEKAKDNFVRAGVEKKITPIMGDAKDVLNMLKETYDFVFMDAAKAQYLAYLEPVFHLLCEGGMILSDNVLSDGEILESHFTVPKRNRTIHDRMRKYLYTLKHHEGLETALLSVGDGVALSVRRTK